MLTCYGHEQNWFVAGKMKMKTLAGVESGGGRKTLRKESTENDFLALENNQIVAILALFKKGKKT